MTYTLTYNLDGAERSEPIAAAHSRSSAIAIAKDAFERVIAKARPAEAYVAVFEGEGDSAEPLGVWDYQPKRRPLLKWDEARD